MEDAVGEYEELEDDFLLMANEGQPALVEVEVDEKEANKAEYANKGVVIVRDEEEEKLKEMREMYKKRLGIGQKKEV